MNKHGDRYTYDVTEYFGNTKKLNIVCKVHGEFSQLANDHLQGKGCRKCAKKYIPTTQEIIEEFKKIHGDVYDYRNVIYTKGLDKVNIICKQHGEFNQTPKRHKSGEGCPKCGIIKSSTNIFNSKGFYSAKRAERNKSKWENTFAILYFVKIYNQDEIFYKVGITTKSIEERFKNLKIVIEVIKEVKTNLYNACILENKILLDNIEHRYTPKTFLNHGNTECFNENITVLKII